MTKNKEARPSLSPEEKIERIAKRNASTKAYHKSTGYAAQRKYQQSHKEQYHTYQKKSREKLYEPKIRIPIERKGELLQLLADEDVSLTQMFVSLIREKYGLDLTKGKDL